MDWVDANTDIPDEDSLRARLPRSVSRRMRPAFGEVAHKPTAHHLVIEALSAAGKVDFPTVTEICEGVAGNPEEMIAVAQLLSAAMQKGAAGSEEALPLLL